MNDTAQTADISVRKSLVVAAPITLAFEVFTARIETWWPMTSHHIGQAECAAVVIEPREAGRWFERGVDGTECDWGHVLVWDAPNRVVLAWKLSAQWQFDPKLHTEVDVCFTSLDRGHTRIDLEHRGLAAYGDSALAMHGIFSSPSGWTGMLDQFATVTAALHTAAA